MLLDLAGALGRVGGDQGLLAELIQQFLGDLPRQLSLITSSPEAFSPDATDASASRPAAPAQLRSVAAESFATPDAPLASIASKRGG